MGYLLGARRGAHPERGRSVRGNAAEHGVERHKLLRRRAGPEMPSSLAPDSRPGVGGRKGSPFASHQVVRPVRTPRQREGHPLGRESPTPGKPLHTTGEKMLEDHSGQQEALSGWSTPTTQRSGGRSSTLAPTGHHFFLDNPS